MKINTIENVKKSRTSLWISLIFFITRIFCFLNNNIENSQWVTDKKEREFLIMSSLCGEASSNLKWLFFLKHSRQLLIRHTANKYFSYLFVFFIFFVGLLTSKLVLYLISNCLISFRQMKFYCDFWEKDFFK